MIDQTKRVAPETTHLDVHVQFETPPNPIRIKGTIVHVTAEETIHALDNLTFTYVLPHGSPPSRFRALLVLIEDDLEG